MVEGTSEPKETPAAKTAPAASKTGKAPVKTSKPPPKATDMTPAQLNKEVFSVLKELNENYKQQNSRIDKQNEKIESLSKKLDDIYDYEYDDEAEGEFEYEDQVPDDDDCSLSGLTQTVNEEPPTKKQKTDHQDGSIFKSLSDKFQSLESTDPATKFEELADFVTTSFRNGITEDKQAELLKNIRRPSNVEGLQKTRVNQGIWRLLKSQTQTDDSKMQTIQNLILKASICQVKLFDKYVEKFEPEDIELLSNSLALLGQSNKLINTKRKETHKGDLDPKYHYLCSATLPFTEFLYGTDGDVNKNVREINDLNRIGRNQKGQNNKAFGPRGRGRSFRRPFRGRSFVGSGRGRYDVGAASGSGTKNQKQGHKK